MDEWLECEEGFVLLAEIVALGQGAWYTKGGWLPYVVVTVTDEIKFKYVAPGAKPRDLKADALAVSMLVARGVLNWITAARRKAQSLIHNEPDRIIPRHGESGPGDDSTGSIGQAAPPTPSGVPGTEPAHDGSPLQTAPG